jgi:gamma-glutamyltranspeptidase / glutathione hydrolase
LPDRCCALWRAVAHGPKASPWQTPLYDLVGAKLKAMGHNVNSVSGEIMGGVQTLMYVPQPDGKFGYYRSGSDFRKDGQAVGW